MHVPLLQKSHVISQLIDRIEHHKLATILVAITGLWLGYTLSTTTDHQVFTQQSTSPTVSASSSGIEKPLTLIDDPQYAHEYDTRAQ